MSDRPLHIRDTREQWPVKIIGEHILHSTGCFDKDGVMIFEGDVTDIGYCYDHPCEIVFIDGMFFFRDLVSSEAEFIRNSVSTNEECMTFICQSRADDVKVIGNKHGPKFKLFNMLEFTYEGGPDGKNAVSKTED